MTTPLRDYAKIEKKKCQLVTNYEGKKFSLPHGVAIGPNDEVVIVDSNNEEVIIFDKDLKLIRTFGQGSGDNKLNYPTGVAIGHNVIVVSEFHAHVVKKFSLQGDCLSQFGLRGSRDGEFYRPQGLCFNSKGLLYVVDHGNCRVQVFRENVFQFKFCSEGRNPGQFKEPRYITVDSSDQLYVTDQCTDSGISVFTEDGCFIKRINYSKSFIICIAPDDHIIATVNDHYSITVFSPTHESIAKFGIRGEKKRI